MSDLENEQNPINYILNQPVHAKSINEEPSQRELTISETIDAILASANKGVDVSRRVMKRTAMEVVERSLFRTLHLSDINHRVFIAVRELEDYVNMAINGHQPVVASAHTDLLPIGHPLSTNPVEVSERTRRVAISNWMSADKRISEEFKPLVASICLTSPGSVEYNYLATRLESAAPQDVPKDVVVAITAAMNPFAGGNSFLERSARAKLQRRDRLGRFAWMGGGARAFIRDLKGFIRSVLGRFVGSDPNSDTFDVEFIDDPVLGTGVYRMKTSNVSGVKAYLRNLGSKLFPIGKMKSATYANDYAINQNELEKIDAPYGWKVDQLGQGVPYEKQFSSNDGYVLRQYKSTADIPNYEEVSGQVEVKGLGKNGEIDPKYPVYELFTDPTGSSDAEKFAGEGNNFVGYYQSWGDVQAAAQRVDKKAYKKIDAKKEKKMWGDVPEGDYPSDNFEQVSPADDQTPFSTYRTKNNAKGEGGYTVRRFQPEKHDAVKSEMEKNVADGAEVRGFTSGTSDIDYEEPIFEVTRQPAPWEKNVEPEVIGYAQDWEDVQAMAENSELSTPRGENPRRSAVKKFKKETGLEHVDDKNVVLPSDFLEDEKGKLHYTPEDPEAPRARITEDYRGNWVTEVYDNKADRDNLKPSKTITSRSKEDALKDAADYLTDENGVREPSRKKATLPSDMPTKTMVMAPKPEGEDLPEKEETFEEKISAEKTYEIPEDVVGKTDAFGRDLEYYVDKDGKKIKNEDLTDADKITENRRVWLIDEGLLVDGNGKLVPEDPMDEKPLEWYVDDNGIRIENSNLTDADKKPENKRIRDPKKGIVYDGNGKEVEYDPGFKKESSPIAEVNTEEGDRGFWDLNEVDPKEVIKEKDLKEQGFSDDEILDMMFEALYDGKMIEVSPKIAVALSKIARKFSKYIGADPNNIGKSELARDISDILQGLPRKYRNRLKRGVDPAKLNEERATKLLNMLKQIQSEGRKFNDDDLAAIHREFRTEMLDVTNIKVRGRKFWTNNNMGAVRIQMPQISTRIDEADIVLYAQKQGITVKPGRKRVDELTPVQAEMDMGKIDIIRETIVTAYTDGHPKQEWAKGVLADQPPLFVTKDGYVIDGHHRWAAMAMASMELGIDLEMDTIELGLNHEDALKWCNEFNDFMGIKRQGLDSTPGGIKPKKEVEVPGEVGRKAIPSAFDEPLLNPKETYPIPDVSNVIGADGKQIKPALLEWYVDKYGVRIPESRLKDSDKIPERRRVRDLENHRVLDGLGREVDFDPDYKPEADPTPDIKPDHVDGFWDANEVSEDEVVKDITDPQQAYEALFDGGYIEVDQDVALEAVRIAMEDREYIGPDDNAIGASPLAREVSSVLAGLPEKEERRLRRTINPAALNEERAKALRDFILAKNGEPLTESEMKFLQRTYRNLGVDLTNMRIKGSNNFTNNNLGAERGKMPQLSTPEDQADFEAALDKLKIKHTATTMTPDQLTPVQAEMDMGNVGKIMKSWLTPELRAKYKMDDQVLYVTRDGYVIDGHHRWASALLAQMSSGEPVNLKVVVVDLDHEDALRICNEYNDHIGVTRQTLGATSADDDPTPQREVAGQVGRKGNPPITPTMQNSSSSSEALPEPRKTEAMVAAEETFGAASDEYAKIKARGTGVVPTKKAVEKFNKWLETARQKDREVKQRIKARLQERFGADFVEKFVKFNTDYVRLDWQFGEAITQLRELVWEAQYDTLEKAFIELNLEDMLKHARLRGKVISSEEEIGEFLQGIMLDYRQKFIDGEVENSSGQVFLDLIKDVSPNHPRKDVIEALVNKVYELQNKRKDVRKDKDYVKMQKELAKISDEEYRKYLEEQGVEFYNGDGSEIFVFTSQVSNEINGIEAITEQKRDRGVETDASVAMRRALKKLPKHMVDRLAEIVARTPSGKIRVELDNDVHWGFKSDRGFLRLVEPNNNGNKGDLVLRLSPNNNDFGSADYEETASHELMHALEMAFPELRQAEWHLFASRTMSYADFGEAIPESAHGDKIYPTGRERGYTDNFKIAYAGKPYQIHPLGNYEIASTAMESMMGRGVMTITNPKVLDAVEAGDISAEDALFADDSTALLLGFMIDSKSMGLPITDYQLDSGRFISARNSANNGLLNSPEAIVEKDFPDVDGKELDGIFSGTSFRSQEVRSRTKILDSRTTESTDESGRKTVKVVTTATYETPSGETIDLVHKEYRNYQPGSDVPHITGEVFIETPEGVVSWNNNIGEFYYSSPNFYIDETTGKARYSLLEMAPEQREKISLENDRSDEDTPFPYSDDPYTYVSSIWVEEEFQRQGIATAMLELARAQATVPIFHSSSRTPDGQAFSAEVKNSKDISSLEDLPEAKDLNTLSEAETSDLISSSPVTDKTIKYRKGRDGIGSIAHYGYRDQEMGGYKPLYDADGEVLYEKLYDRARQLGASDKEADKIAISQLSDIVNLIQRKNDKSLHEHLVAQGEKAPAGASEEVVRERKRWGERWRYSAEKVTQAVSSALTRGKIVEPVSIDDLEKIIEGKRAFSGNGFLADNFDTGSSLLSTDFVGAHNVFEQMRSILGVRNKKHESKIKVVFKDSTRDKATYTIGDTDRSKSGSIPQSFDSIDPDSMMLAGLMGDLDNPFISMAGNGHPTTENNQVSTKVDEKLDLTDVEAIYVHGDEEVEKVSKLLADKYPAISVVNVDKSNYPSQEDSSIEFVPYSGEQSGYSGLQNSMAIMVDDLPTADVDKESPVGEAPPSPLSSQEVSEKVKEVRKRLTASKLEIQTETDTTVSEGRRSKQVHSIATGTYTLPNGRKVKLVYNQNSDVYYKTDSKEDDRSYVKHQSGMVLAYDEDGREIGDLQLSSPYAFIPRPSEQDSEVLYSTVGIDFETVPEVESQNFFDFLYQGISWIGVRPPYERQGIGTAMLEFARHTSGNPIYHSEELSPDGRRFSKEVRNSASPDADLLPEPASEPEPPQPRPYELTPKKKKGMWEDIGLSDEPTLWNFYSNPRDLAMYNPNSGNRVDQFMVRMVALASTRVGEYFAGDDSKWGGFVKKVQDEMKPFLPSNEEMNDFIKTLPTYKEIEAMGWRDPERERLRDAGWRGIEEGREYPKYEDMDIDSQRRLFTELWLKTIPRERAQELVRKNAEIVRRNLREFKLEDGISLGDAVDRLTTSLKNEMERVTSTGEISLTMPRTRVNLMLRDGRYKTAFEATSPNKGTYQRKYVDSRYERETALGVPTNIPESQRPVSGVIGEDGMTYGTVRVTLKDSVKNRTTATIGDSLDGKTSELAWLEEYSSGKMTDERLWEIFGEELIFRTLNRNLSPYFRWDETAGTQDIPLGFNNIDNIYDFANYGYIEAQIHGGVNLSDVKSIALPPDFKIKPEFRQKLEELGIIITREVIEQGNLF